MNLETGYFKKLAQLLNENGLSELSLQDGDKKVTIKREGNVVKQTEPIRQIIKEEENVEVDKQPQKPKRTPILSPMVGSFYSASSPSAPPFVSVGDTIAAGQVVCIIEAMKLMNEIEADVSGKIVQIGVENVQSVEYGQVLMYVE